MSDEILTWTEADKAALLDAVVKAACECNEGGLCAVCDAMIYGGDQVDAIVGARDRVIALWRKRALEAEEKLRAAAPPPKDDAYSIPFFGDYPAWAQPVTIQGGRPLSAAIIRRAAEVAKGNFGRPRQFLLPSNDKKR